MEANKNVRKIIWVNGVTTTKKIPVIKVNGRVNTIVGKCTIIAIIAGTYSESEAGAFAVCRIPMPPNAGSDTANATTSTGMANERYFT